MSGIMPPGFPHDRHVTACREVIAKCSRKLMDTLLPLAQRIAARLIERRETIAVAEGSAGGLIAAALLAVPGASAYFLGGAVVYTAAARTGLLDIGAADMAGFRPASEPYALLLARRTRERLGATRGLRGTGAAGPARQPHRDPARPTRTPGGPAGGRARAPPTR